MRDEAVYAGGRRLAADLRRLREATGLSVEEVQERTKIRHGLITSFEQTALFENPLFQGIYLRCFVQAYARAMGLAPDVVLRALEEARQGVYQGGLAAMEPAPPPRLASSPPSPEQHIDR